MKYFVPVVFLLAALGLIFLGLATMASAGICDQCSGDTTTGKLEVAAGGLGLLASLAAAAWVSRER
jgi:hypothetical protein